MFQMRQKTNKPIKPVSCYRIIREKLSYPSVPFPEIRVIIKSIYVELMERKSPVESVFAISTGLIINTIYLTLTMAVYFSRKSNDCYFRWAIKKAICTDYHSRNWLAELHRG